MARPHTPRNQDGFTIIEVMMAALILLVGILGVTTIVNTANGTTTSNKAREQGLALGRELIESARSVKYQTLRPSTVVASVQAMPGFASAGGSGWTIKRRGITYTVSLGVCSVDDPGDATGAHVAGTFCARPAVAATAATCTGLIGTPPRINGTGGSPGADAGDCGLDTNLDGQVDGLVQSTTTGCPSGTSIPAGTCDAQPDDFKRLVTLVTWDRGAGSRYVIQQATVPFPGLSAYGAITAITPDVGTATANGYTITPGGGGANVSAIHFTATSDQSANQVNWLLGGVDQGPTTWSGTSGTFTWNLGNSAPAAETSPANGEVLDGTYLVGARVQDAGGIHGNELDVGIVLNRRIPFPPTGFSLTGAGSGSVTGSWNAPPDGDLVGYTMYRQNGSGTPQQICQQIAALSCTDTNPPTGVTATYWVVALDTLDGAVREGQRSAPQTSTQSASNTAPTTPTLVTWPVTGNGGNQSVTLTWTASTDAQTSVQKYAIYRSAHMTTSVCSAQTTPISYSNGPATTYTDPIGNNKDFDYCVSAIDTQGLEGAKSAAQRVQS
ncbi:MAG TPA: prepilin-type N-terminal cleavage/methylation domain-containing protein [Baekduia sp.]|uniref:prepilin-type N-terminal cleavage/methylation domain-containing protein n=1 Tax=Baekduia sp. TaxID=2600305 RepID=UPI002C5B18C8|nr:prepilin-type N-terminal cleavage/methylation domain-containing protein [Baekduia sp.]HMJ32718.1 prepilin-type N-terminal cleavage/methylation domain-containing protein [Baekduia sp.]